MKITVYTITDCKFSAQEKDYLKANNQTFEEKNLETNKDFLTEMLNLSNNFAGTPVTVIEKDDGQKVVLKGFTKEEFDKELNIGASTAAPATTGEEVKAPEVAAAAPASPEPAPVVPPAAPTPVPPAPSMPEPPAPTMPSMPPASEPSMPPAPAGEPTAPTTPSIDETPVAPPAPAPVMPEPVVPAMAPSVTEPAAPAMPAAVPEPAAAPVVPTGSPAPTAAPAAPAPAANDDALNAILNNLQEKVNQDAPKPPTQ